MIDLSTALPLRDVASLLPPGRRGRPVTQGCVMRWILRGVKGPGGRRVRLEAVRLGGRWLTSLEALERFALAQTPGAGGEPPTSSGPHDDKCERAARTEAVEFRLGI
jgi:hypothetical protein